MSGTLTYVRCTICKAYVRWSPTIRPHYRQHRTSVKPSVRPAKSPDCPSCFLSDPKPKLISPTKLLSLINILGHYSARERIDRRSTIKRTTPTIERSHALVNSIVAGPNLKIGLGFILLFLGFLGTSRVPLNSINRLVNTELHTRDFGEELKTL